MKTTTTSLTVNGVSLEWSEDSKNKLRPCRHCKTPTRGREESSKEGSDRKARSLPACMGCALKAVMQGAFRGAAIFNPPTQGGA